jgi:hypothetical protein
VKTSRPGCRFIGLAQTIAVHRPQELINILKLNDNRCGRCALARVRARAVGEQRSPDAAGFLR